MLHNALTDNSDEICYNQVDKDGNSILHHAAITNKVEACTYAVTKLHVDLSLKNKFNELAIDIPYANADMTKYLATIMPKSDNTLLTRQF